MKGKVLKNDPVYFFCYMNRASAARSLHHLRFCSVCVVRIKTEFCSLESELKDIAKARDRMRGNCSVHRSFLPRFRCCLCVAPCGHKSLMRSAENLAVKTEHSSTEALTGKSGNRTSFAGSLLFPSDDVSRMQGENDVTDIAVLS